MKEEMTVELDIEKIELSGTNPRAGFDEEGLKKLSCSIGGLGMIQPLIVRKKGKKYVLVAGERRLEAAKLAGLKTVPVIVRDLDDTEALAVQLAENLDREDLDPLEEAQGFRQLQEAGWTQEQIGERFSTSQEQVSNRIRLLRLPEKLHDIISRGIITPGHAKELLRLRTKKEQIDIAKEVTRWDRKPSVKETKKAVDRRLDYEESREEFRKVYRKAKVKKCPECGEKALMLDKRFKKPVLTCCQYYVERGHRWDPETGEIVKTKQEIQEEAARKQKAKEAAERRKVRGPSEKHVPTMPAWIFSLATKQQWAKALTEQVAENIRIMGFGDKDLYDLRSFGSRKFVIQFPDDYGLIDDAFTVRPVDVHDGDRHFETRITIGEYRSSSQPDNVARGKDNVAKVKKAVKRLMQFQRDKIEVPQKTNECMIREFDGFKLGGKVKVSKEFRTKSYRKAGAEVVGFSENGHAVLNYSKPTKVIHIENLEVVEKKEPVEKKVHCDSCGCDNVPEKDKNGNVFCAACEELIEVAS